MLSSGPVGDEVKEIVIDTETTGLDCQGGHRVVEIGCVELGDRFERGHGDAHAARRRR